MKNNKNIVLKGFIINNTKIFVEMLRIINSQTAKSTFRRLNYLPIDDKLFGLSADEIEIRQTFRNFFETELGPHAKSIDDADDFPGFKDYIKKCGDMGILGKYSMCCFRGNKK
jgi:hypothetical protein